MGLFTRKPSKPAGARNAYCSFCRKSHMEAGPLAEGPNDVYICRQCAIACKELIEAELERREPVA
jgi:ATP-dependent Clp protease ATP-binding subunit ClpX